MNPTRRFTVPEYCFLAIAVVVIILLTAYRLPFRVSPSSFLTDIDGVLLIFSLAIALAPVSYRFAEGILARIAFLGRILSAPDAGESEINLPEGLKAEWKALSAGLQVLRDWLPLFAFMSIYWASGALASRLYPSQSRDGALAALDLKIFGAHLSVLAQRFYSPALTSIFEFCYFMHIIIIPLFLVLLYVKANRPLFQRTMTFLMITSALGAAGYLLVPAYGPYVYLRNFYHTDISMDPVNVFIGITRAPLDAFPSLHVALSAGLLPYMWRYGKWLFFLLLPLILGNWISTVYLRYHYTVDVLAGFLLALFSLGITEASFYFWERA